MSACIGVWVYTYSGIRILVHVGALVCVLLRYSVCGCVNSTWNFTLPYEREAAGIVLVG